MSQCPAPWFRGQSRGQTGVLGMVNERPDRLEEIAAARGTDPDVRWLLDEVLRLRDLVDREHGVALDLAQVAIQRLTVVTAEVAAVISLLTPT